MPLHAFAQGTKAKASTAVAGVTAVFADRNVVDVAHVNEP